MTVAITGEPHSAHAGLAVWYVAQRMSMSMAFIGLPTRRPTLPSDR